jgi:sugar phosphate isomerase/epimerase
MRRREVLGALGALALAPSILAASLRQQVKAIGLQLYTVRAALEADFDATLARVAAIGYREVEFAGYFGHSAQEVRAKLNANGLVSSSAHVSLDATGAGWEGVLQDALTIGQQYLVVASVGSVSDIDGYRRIAERFNRAGEIAKKSGIRLAYHNHDYEFTPMQGKLPYDVLLEETNPDFVCFEIDLYWIFKGGQDPLKYFKRWPGRIRMLHLKDAARSPPHQMTEVGAGMLDWQRILSSARSEGVEHYFVEQDKASDPFASIAASYSYLRQLRF